MSLPNKPLPNKRHFHEHSGFKAWLAAFDLAAKAAIVGSLLWGVYTYRNATAQERQDREIAIYDRLDEKYWEFQLLCTRHPEFNYGWACDDLAHLFPPRENFTPVQRIQERRGASLAIAMYESAFIRFSDESSEFREAQWVGWAHSLEQSLKAPAFREAWDAVGRDFDSRFVEFVNEMIRQK